MSVCNSEKSRDNVGPACCVVPPTMDTYSSCAGCKYVGVIVFPAKINQLMFTRQTSREQVVECFQLSLQSSIMQVGSQLVARQRESLLTKWSSSICTRQTDKAD